MTGHLILAVCTAAVVSVVAVTEADASGHIRKHHPRTSHHQRTNIGFNDPRNTGVIAPAARSSGRGAACPGNSRAIDCTVWPPPFDEDPDRKATSSDGG
jgi:hypothetical protein